MLAQMEELDPDIEMDDQLTDALNKALSELYEMTVNVSELEAVS